MHVILITVWLAMHFTESVITLKTVYVTKSAIIDYVAVMGAKLISVLLHKIIVTL